MKRSVLILFALLLGVSPLLAAPAMTAPWAQQAPCLFFTETGGGQGGYTVCDDANARFRSAFDSWGLQRVGYPISQRYEKDGFTTQAFQKAIMQWRPDTNSVALVNIFDDLHNAGYDERLFRVRQVPNQLTPGWDGEGLSFEQIVTKRQDLLDERPALRQAYFGVNNPLLFFGLPTSTVTDMGNHYAIRLQRAVLQEWKEAVPWASAGQVTIANGGDIAKELGALPALALSPTASPTPDSNLGVVKGHICYPSNYIPEMNAYFQNVATNRVEVLPIAEDQIAYEISLPVGEYIAYAWLPSFDFGGLYSPAVACGLSTSCNDHTPLVFAVKARETTHGVHICDWYDSQPYIPLPPGSPIRFD